MRRRDFALLAGSFLARPASAVTPVQNVVVAVQSLPPVLEPGGDFSNVGWRVFANLFDTLITLDIRGDFHAMPGLATGWRRIDDHTLDVTLREDVRFHDGNALSTEDVVFTFGPERM